MNGGKISDRKGINVPNVDLSMPYLSDKDRDDIEFGIKAGFDFIAASFTRCAQDIMQIRELLQKHNCDSIVGSEMCLRDRSMLVPALLCFLVRLLPENIR